MKNLFSVASVMVVDDETFFLSYVQRLLQDMGIGEIILAENGEDALEKLRHCDSGLNLIVCDIEMPLMDGYELIRRIRYGAVPEFKDIPIIVLTGKDTDKNVQHARVLKIDGFIVKPPDKNNFNSKVRHIISAQMRDALGD